MKKLYFYSLTTYKNGVVHRALHGDIEVSGELSSGAVKLIVDEISKKISPLEEGECTHLNALNQI